MFQLLPPLCVNAGKMRRDCCIAGIMEVSIAAIELRRRQQGESAQQGDLAQSNVAERRKAQAAQEQQELTSVSPH